jgi:hypothetical protein
MLKHLSGVKKIGQDETMLSLGYDWADADILNAAGQIEQGQGTAGTSNSFDWVNFIDSLGQSVSIGFDAAGQFIIAQATAEQMSMTPTGSLPLPAGAIEPAGYISQTDTQMFLYVALIGMGLIFLSRKL